MACFPLLRYAEAHAAFRRANADEIKRWSRSRSMRLVQEYEFEMAEGALADAAGDTTSETSEGMGPEVEE